MNKHVSLGNQANDTNWRVAPFNRWSFHNIQKVLTTHQVASGGRAAEFQADRKKKRGLLLNGLFLRITKTDAVVALLDGRIVYEWYAHGNMKDTPHILMSSTKAVIGLLAGVLSARGKLQLSTPVTDHVQEIAGTLYEGVTLHDLLDMRVDVSFDAGQQRSYDEAINWGDEPRSAAGADLRAFFKSLQVPAAKHGGPFCYVSANTDLAGWAIERATGQTVAELLTEYLWKPMGAESAAHLTVDRAGLARSSGGFCATARDFARLGQLIVDGGSIGGKSVVPKWVIDDIYDNGDAEAWRTGEWGQQFGAIGKKMRYRAGWYAVDDDPQVLFAMGIHGQNLFIDRKRRLVVAKLSSWSKPIERLPLFFTHRAFSRLQRSIRGATL